MRRLVILSLCLVPLLAHASEPVTSRTALQSLHDLIGSWKATGEPLLGSREERLKGFWVENIAWSWKFKGDDAWLKADFTKGKYYQSAEMRYDPATEKYRLKLTMTEKKPLVFEGTRQDRKLILERTDETSKDVHRLTFNLLHAERHLVRYEVQPGGKTRFVGQWQIGATKQGVPFATTQAMRECLVSGGLGTSPVMYKGVTYYVCCSGCRDAFNEEPEKYIQEFEAKRKK